ncbi:hypothetical protein [Sulfuricystis multivorans]|uniref:hypothetical protein n=1 Tax=Sulfuricystis multivorans TaxID=2211108 RepID=UPI000F835181|nr:hypothetical protein [Sulfuricystis multivorans]
MVICPKKISPDDADWQQACALMQVLALDPRRPQNRAARHLGRYFESADDILERPNIWVNHKLIPAPYFSYYLQFNVAVSVIGQIPIDDEQQITEFRRVVNSALRNELTTAIRKSWEANEQRLVVLRKAYNQYPQPDDATANDKVMELLAVAAAESAKAQRYYMAVRDQIEAPRRYDGVARPSLSRHEEVLAGLIRLGTMFLQAA